jgi:hypothetical protein
VPCRNESHDDHDTYEFQKGEFELGIEDLECPKEDARGRLSRIEL